MRTERRALSAGPKSRTGGQGSIRSQYGWRCRDLGYRCLVGFAGLVVANDLLHEHRPQSSQFADEAQDLRPREDQQPFCRSPWRWPRRPARRPDLLCGCQIPPDRWCALLTLVFPRSLFVARDRGPAPVAFGHFRSRLACETSRCRLRVLIDRRRRFIGLAPSATNQPRLRSSVARPRATS
jgi:hypothetical protein